MKLSRIFQKRDVWTIALYKLKYEDDIFKLNEHKPFHFFGERGIRRNKEYQAFTADPFLFVHSVSLYLFYEIKTDFGVGEIWAQSMDAQGAWTNHGQVLKEDFHLSYPQVFIHDGQIYMVPEAAQTGKVWLYTAVDFPGNWQKVRVLIDEPLLDPSILIRQEGIFLLATTREYELKLYFSPDLSQEFVAIEHLITNDKSLARNAGSPLCIQNVLYRVAQNCKFKYGQNISIMRIDQLSTKGYSEQIVTSDLYQTKPEWMAAGYHHISTALFRNEYFVAVDGARRDGYINTLLLAFFKVLG